MSLTDLSLDSIGKEIDLMRGDVAHTRSLVALHTNAWGKLPMHEAAVLRLVHDYERVIAKFDLRLKGMNAEMRSLSRSAHKNRNSSSTMGRTGRAKGLIGIVDRELETLHGEVSALRAKVEQTLADPGRWGDASLATGPVMAFLNLLNTLLEMLNMAHKKKRNLARSNNPGG